MFLFKMEKFSHIFDNNDVISKFEGGSKEIIILSTKRKVFRYCKYLFSLIIFTKLLESPEIDSNIGSAVSWP